MGLRERLGGELVVDSKYDSLWGGWYSLEFAGAFNVGLWKNIRKGRENSFSFTKFEVEMVPRSTFGMTSGVGKRL
jgi:hypothetical protein